MYVIVDINPFCFLKTNSNKVGTNPCTHKEYSSILWGLFCAQCFKKCQQKDSLTVLISKNGKK